MTSDPTGAALLRTVCLDPDDVGARLVYADWLEQEAGDAERGEFIRVQCELDGMGGVPDLYELKARMTKFDYSEASEVVAITTESVLLNQKTCYFIRQHFDDGATFATAPLAPYRVLPLSAGVYEVSFRFRPDGEKVMRANDLRRRERELLAAPAPGGWNPNPGNGYHWSGPAFWHAGTDVRWSFRRGFVEAVACTAAAWEQHGPALVLAQPVWEVRAAGAEPLWVDIPQRYYHEKPWTWLEPGVTSDGRHYWFDRTFADPRHTPNAHHLPGWLFECLEGRRFDHCAYATREDALDALSRACVTWARRQAGLDVRCRWCVSPTGGKVSPLYGPCPDCKGAGWRRAE